MFDVKRFKAQMALRGMNGKKISEALGINEATFYRKLKADGDFSREEINKLIDILRIENPEEIFFTSELA